MLIIREVFIAKPGMASKLAKMWKELWPDVRVMTDMIGVFNKVVMETEVESLDHVEKRLASYEKIFKGNSQYANYADLYAQGKREIYRIW
jgi:hypothetical protein